MADEKNDNEAKIRTSGEMLGVIESTHMMITIICAGAAFVYLRYVLVPLLMAYFLTFLLAPIMDSMEDRPYQLFGSYYCKQNFLHPRRKEYMGTSRGDLLEIILLCKVPHGLAILATLIVGGGIFYMLMMLIINSVLDFAKTEDKKTQRGITPMGLAVNNMLNDGITMLEESGVQILRPWQCSANSTVKLATRLSSTDTTGIDVLSLFVYDVTRGAAPITMKGETQLVCKKVNVFGCDPATQTCGTTPSELGGQINTMIATATDMITILLLSIYILLERPAGRTIQGDHIVMGQIENMMKNYIVLKTVLSAGTGLAVGIFLIACNVPLAPVFALLAFMLNYIPAVGSLIACVLPIPVIILDEDMTGMEKAVALLGPTSVQLYVGNALEPMLFGASLNLTALAILNALTFFAALWGLQGAVLSVPLLAAAKIIMHHTDHPTAKSFLVLIREEKSADIAIDEDFVKAEQEWDRVTNLDEVELLPTGGAAGEGGDEEATAE